MSVKWPAAATLMACACVGTEIGNPPTPAEASVSVDVVGVVEAPARAIPIGLTVNVDVEVDRAVLLVGDLRFREDGTSCGEAGADHTDGFVAELLEPGVELSGLELPAGAYCGIDVRPRRGGDDGFASEHPELRGVTAYAEGTYRGAPFVVRNESDDELSFRGSFELPARDQVVFVAVDIPMWFDDVDFAAAEVDGDGRILLGHEGSFEETIKDNVIRSVSVALDANGDRVLTGEDDHDDEGEHE